MTPQEGTPQEAEGIGRRLKTFRVWVGIALTLVTIYVTLYPRPVTVEDEDILRVDRETRFWYRYMNLMQAIARRAGSEALRAEASYWQCVGR